MATKGKHSWDQGLEQVGLVLGCGCGTGFPRTERTSEAYRGWGVHCPGQEDTSLPGIQERFHSGQGATRVEKNEGG